ncbi:gamma-soluble NSF attachment protein [Strongylocentrotus purpuratus]|uniref:Gamma-soluble NSF attachment protein n=1 Tax=Strongylocentrotus purpuratus TaxID=7668 RepID=A0A7M7N5G2_STRPU|nr:gamma-soluble NSF attachment protein [Strongylocentrotus purpuratus]
MADARRISEAKEHIAAAEKSLKTSFFKWKPDFGSAAHEYEQAAVCFKNAKQPLEAKRAYINAAGAHRNNDALFHAAKQYEQAAFLMRDQKDWGEVMGLFDKAASLYSEHGTPDTAAICLEKAAKMMETVNPRMSLEFFQKACDVVELEDRPRQIVDYLGKSARILVRIQDYDEASKVLSKERDLRHDLGDIDATNRTVSALVLVHLKRGDYVAADKMCGIAMGSGYAESDVASALACLLDAYDKQDEDTFHQMLNLPLFRYMDNDYVKLARSLRLPGGSRPKQKAVAPMGEMGPVGGAEGGEELVDEDNDEEFDLK